jgi:single-strand DNA-binding protein
MDLNLVVLSGRLAAPPEYREFSSGARLARYLVTVRSDRPRRRVDVLPVTQWEPAEDEITEPVAPGRGIWIAGGVQRRFWDGDSRRRSRLEVIAHQIEFREPEERTAPESA